MKEGLQPAMQTASKEVLQRWLCKADASYDCQLASQAMHGLQLHITAMGIRRLYDRFMLARTEEAFDEMHDAIKGCHVVISHFTDPQPTLQALLHRPVCLDLTCNACSIWGLGDASSITHPYQGTYRYNNIAEFLCVLSVLLFESKAHPWIAVLHMCMRDAEAYEGALVDSFFT